MVIVKRSHIKKRAAVILSGLVLLAVLFLLSSLVGELFLPLAAVVVIACVLADISAFVAYSSTSIESTDKGVVFSSGIVNKSVVNYPYSKITSTRMDVSLFNRIFGLKTLMLDTAGEAGMDLVIEDLPAGDCDRLYKEINERMESAKGQGNE
jgi:uncharacterized membrane protein YdbT with pleckstrin-like domain